MKRGRRTGTGRRYSNTRQKRRVSDGRTAGFVTGACFIGPSALRKRPDMPGLVAVTSSLPFLFGFTLKETLPCASVFLVTARMPTPTSRTSLP